MRKLVVRLHRWVALLLGQWFVLLALTGAVLVWQDALDAALNPAWLATPSRCGTPSGPAIGTALAVFAEAQPGARPAMVAAPHTTGAAYIVWERKSVEGTRRQHFIDVGCARYLGARDWGAARLDGAHIVPAINELHRSLLRGETGHTMVGLGGLVLLGVSLTGLYVAWPRGSTREGWRRALSIKGAAALPRRMYDLHRATGLWLLPFLLLMTISGAYLCFPKEGRAFVGTMLPMLDGGLRKLPKASAVEGPAQAPDAVVAAAEKLWPQAQWSRIQFPDGARKDYEVRLLQRGELRADTGDTRVRLTPQGQVLAVRDALDVPAGDALLAWMFPLHSAEVLGLAGRAAWTLFGLLPALLFGTAVWLWWRRSVGERRRRHAATTGIVPRDPSLESR